MIRPRMIELQKVVQARGNLAIGELGDGLPFAAQRFFLVHDIPRGVGRGAHAHRQCEQLLVCVAGGVTVATDDGARQRLFLLERPWQALYVPALVWTEQSFAFGARLLVLASERYDEADYIRDRAEFDRLTAALHPAIGASA